MREVGVVTLDGAQRFVPSCLVNCGTYNCVLRAFYEGKPVQGEVFLSAPCERVASFEVHLKRGPRPPYAPREAAKEVRLLAQPREDVPSASVKRPIAAKHAAMSSNEN